MFWFSALLDFLPSFEQESVVSYLRSEEAQKSDSLARGLIESSKEFFGNLMEDNPARVLFAALSLGGRTLILLKDSIKDLP